MWRQSSAISLFDDVDSLHVDRPAATGFLRKLLARVARRVVPLSWITSRAERYRGSSGRSLTMPDRQRCISTAERHALLFPAGLNILGRRVEGVIEGAGLM